MLFCVVALALRIHHPEDALIDVALYSIIVSVVFMFVQRIARIIVEAELK